MIMRFSIVEQNNSITTIGIIVYCHHIELIYIFVNVVSAN